MNRVGAVILCGGKSTRMGTDKACLPFHGEPMLVRIVRAVNAVVPRERVVCVAAEGQPLPQLPPKVRVAYDRTPDRGPLEGLAAGLAKQQDGVEAVFVTPCDVPLLQPDFVRFMLDSIGEHELAVPRVDGRWFGLSSVCRPSVLPKVEELLARGERRVRALIAACRTREVTAEELCSCDPQLHSLWNCNAPDEYHTALRHDESKTPP